MTTRELTRIKKKRDARKKFRLALGAIMLIVFMILFNSLQKSLNAQDNDIVSISSLIENSSFSGITLNEPDNLTQPTIIIDPGHGGQDFPGCVYGNYMEKDLNLQLALKVRDSLKALGYQVILTRDTDRAVSLEDRKLIAEKYKAAAFISLHHNAQENDTVTEGIETWYNGTANELNQSFAEHIQQETINATNAKNRGLKRSDEMTLLQGLTIPACLIEVGFLSSNKERVRLIDSNYQDKIVQGIVDGIVISIPRN